jgi:hypothetical protein
LGGKNVCPVSWRASTLTRQFPACTESRRQEVCFPKSLLLEHGDDVDILAVIFEDISFIIMIEAQQPS